MCFFTSLPILFVAIFHREIPLADMMKYPQLYVNGLQDTAFNYRVFWSWLLVGLLHGVVAFYVAYISMDFLGLYVSSIACYNYMVFIVSFKLVLITSWNFWIHFFTWGSIVFWIFFACVYNSIYVMPYLTFAYYTFYVLLTYPQFYAGLLLVCVFAILPDFIWVSFERNFNPKPKHIIQERRHLRGENGEDNARIKPGDGDNIYRELNDPLV